MTTPVNSPSLEPVPPGVLSGARHVPDLFEILHEDEHLLVVNKPAGLVCHPTKTDEYSSLVGRVRLHLGAAAQPQLLNRLDRETSGVTLIAKSLPVAREVRRLWENRQVQKTYWAIVHGVPQAAQGIIDAPLGKAQQSRVAIKDEVRADGVPACTRWWLEQRLNGATQSGNETHSDFALLRVEPETGRKHQIRIHLAHLGHSIVGDKIYGPDEDLYLALVEDRLTPEQRRQLILPHHALHAGRVHFHWRDRQWRFEAQPESWFQEFLQAHTPAG